MSSKKKSLLHPLHCWSTTLFNPKALIDKIDTLENISLCVESWIWWKTDSCIDRVKIQRITFGTFTSLTLFLSFSQHPIADNKTGIWSCLRWWQRDKIISWQWSSRVKLELFLKSNWSLCHNNHNHLHCVHWCEAAGKHIVHYTWTFSYSLDVTQRNLVLSVWPMAMNTYTDAALL